MVSSVANQNPQNRRDVYFICTCCCFFQFVCVESLVTAVVDMYPKIFRRGYRRELLILALSIVSYFIGLIMLTEVRYPLIHFRATAKCHRIIEE